MEIKGNSSDMLMNEQKWLDDKYERMHQKYMMLQEQMIRSVQDTEPDMNHFLASYDLMLNYCFIQIAMEKKYLTEKEQYIIQHFCKHNATIKQFVAGYGIFIRRLSYERFQERKTDMFPIEERTYFIVSYQRSNPKYYGKVTENIDFLRLMESTEDILSDFLQFGSETVEQEKFYLDEILDYIEQESDKFSTEVVEKEELSNLTTAMRQLDDLIGLEPVKQEIRALTANYRVNQIKQKKGLITSSLESYHLVFAGNPGTGKTTVARIVADIYYHLGIISESKVKEVSRVDMVAGYVGQTALKTEAVIKEALGGILFIDEAYSLTESDHPTDFGKEAIDVLLKMMEDYRENLVVIVAGYPDKMETFLDFNPGLKSRFSNKIPFPDYSVDELLRIFDMYIAANALSLDGGVKAEVTFILEKLRKLPNFANGRCVRGIVDQIIRNQNMRIVGMMDENQGEIDEDVLKTITMDDIQGLNMQM